METYENQYKSNEYQQNHNENPWKSWKLKPNTMDINENQWSCLKIIENQYKFSDNQRKLNENRWKNNEKPMKIFVNLSTCYEN